jgi:ACS family D-galactonate transporter-like MFS transporter
MNGSIGGPDEGIRRWGMLAVVSLGIVALTLNWFDVATVFPLVGKEFHVGLGSLSFLISLYIVGYGLSHVPGGMLATRIGMKLVLVLGLLVQGLAGVILGCPTATPNLHFSESPLARRSLPAADYLRRFSFF